MSLLPMTIGAVLSHKNKRTEERQYVNSLTYADIEEMDANGIFECADGCHVEPDGHCEHGYTSPLILLGII